MHFMYGRQTENGLQTDSFFEHHTLGVFTIKTYMDAMRQAGLRDIAHEDAPADVEAGMRSLFIARK
jgi:hypothetical protein